MLLDDWTNWFTSKVSREAGRRELGWWLETRRLPGGTREFGRQGKRLAKK